MKKSPYKLLVIEDNPSDLVNLKREISKMGQSLNGLIVEIKECTNLKEGLAELQNYNYDLLFLDLSLPDSEGLSSIDNIREVYDLPIVVLTGSKEDEIGISSIQHGVQDFLSKEDLKATILKKTILFSIERFLMEKKMEEMRFQQARSLKMATLGEMAGGIAHEINNPLTIIIGHLDLINMNLKNNNIDLSKLESSVGIISNTTKRIARIVKGLRSHSRDDKDDPFTDTKLIDIIDETLGLCREKFKMSEIKLEVGDIPDVEILCKDVQISQVILNLLNNAHDAIRNKNEKWIKLYSQISYDSDFLNLYIVDSGSIKDIKVKNKLFTPFFTTKEKDMGTGLGLSISKAIIESHGGKIELLESKNNTTFKIILPINKAFKNVA